MFKKDVYSTPSNSKLDTWTKWTSHNHRNRCFINMYKSMFLFILFNLVLFRCSAQTGCRRNSNGELYQFQILFSQDFNYDLPCCNVADFCLPVGTIGTPCTIRDPIFGTTYAGIYGNYSAINCDLDDNLHMLLFSSALFGFYMHIKGSRNRLRMSK